MDYFIQGAQLILSISILVVLHELGHFIPAKLFKTRVEKFYLFFNPWFSLVKKKIGDTEYGIGWLPLGGYVKIAGMIDESMDKEQMKQPPQPWEFRSKPAWQRLIIMLGGIIVNVLLAFIIYGMVLFVWGEQYLPAQNAKYGVHCDSLAINIGFQNGDKIIALDNEPVNDKTYGEITAAILLDDIKTVTVDRNNKKEIINIPEGFNKKVIDKKIKGLFVENVPFVIDTLLPNKPAIKSGFKKNDRIIAVNNHSTPYYFEIVDQMKNNKGKEITVDVLRGSDTVSLSVTVTENGTIGIGNKPLDQYFEIAEKHYSFFEAIPAGVNKTISTLDLYVSQFKLLFTKEGIKQVGGFATISKLYGTQWNWQNFWTQTAFISIILAFMNLLPIPALDGGYVLFLLGEIITGRKPSEKFMERAVTAGFIILLLFMLYANTDFLRF
ncbi:MAG: RIP metalloprotease RseP [Vicingaceae bacterium]